MLLNMVIVWSAQPLSIKYKCWFLKPHLNESLMTIQNKRIHCRHYDTISSINNHDSSGKVTDKKYNCTRHLKSSKTVTCGIDKWEK